MISTTIETITPEVARSYLEHNRRNRKVKPRQVESLSRDIKRGNFYLTHQGIAFDESGTLVDGQHRLLASLMANLPITVMVSRNVPVECVNAIDRGETRSVCDVMNIAHQNERSALKDKRIVSALSQLVRCNYKSLKLSTSETAALYDTLSSAVDSVYDIVTQCTAYRRANAPMIAATIAATASGVEAQTIEKFFGVICKADISGCDGLNIQAALNWQRQLDTARAKHITIDRRKLYSGTQNAIWHFSQNTSVTSIKVPNTLRYDLRNIIANVLEDRDA